jgi:hypothetical protein
VGAVGNMVILIGKSANGEAIPFIVNNNWETL